MPVVASFDGANRRIILDASVAGAAWDPIDVYREYRTWREAGNRQWDPLLEMRGGDPKGGGDYVPRYLKLLEDRNSTATLLVLPDTGPYTTQVDGDIVAADPDTSEAVFDTAGFTTSGIFIDYKPPTAQLLDGGGGGGSADEEWDKTLASHQDAGSTGEALEQTRVAALNAMALSA